MNYLWPWNGLYGLLLVSHAMATMNIRHLCSGRHELPTASCLSTWSFDSHNDCHELSATLGRPSKTSKPSWASHEPPCDTLCINNIYKCIKIPYFRKQVNGSFSKVLCIDVKLCLLGTLEKVGWGNFATINSLLLEVSSIFLTRKERDELTFSFLLYLLLNCLCQTIDIIKKPRK
jgi:hypothetical protein